MDTGSPDGGEPHELASQLDGLGMGVAQNCAKTAPNCAESDLGPDFIGTLVPNFSQSRISAQAKETSLGQPFRAVLRRLGLTSNREWG